MAQLPSFDELAASLPLAPVAKGLPEWRPSHVAGMEAAFPPFTAPPPAPPSTRPSLPLCLFASLISSPSPPPPPLPQSRSLPLGLPHTPFARQLNPGETISFNAALYYESEQKVDGADQSILNVIGEGQPTINAENNVAILIFRLEKVSRRKDGQRFRVYLEPDVKKSTFPGTVRHSHPLLILFPFYTYPIPIPILYLSYTHPIPILFPSHPHPIFTLSSYKSIVFTVYLLCTRSCTSRRLTSHHITPPFLPSPLSLHSFHSFVGLRRPHSLRSAPLTPLTPASRSLPGFSPNRSACYRSESRQRRRR